MSKFKPGDSVKRTKIEAKEDGLSVGDIRTVEAVSPVSGWLTLEGHPSEFAWCPAYFELVEPTATPAPAGPVRMVRQIVPGVYGRLQVYATLGKTIVVKTTKNDDGYEVLDADELRSAAMVLSQLAEALDDQP